MGYVYDREPKLRGRILFLTPLFYIFVWRLKLPVVLAGVLFNAFEKMLRKCRAGLSALFGDRFLGGDDGGDNSRSRPFSGGNGGSTFSYWSGRGYRLGDG